MLASSFQITETTTGSKNCKIGKANFAFPVLSDHIGVTFVNPSQATLQTFCLLEAHEIERHAIWGYA